MPHSSIILAQARQFIENDNLPAAIQLLSQLLNNSPVLDSIILQSARYSRISAQIRSGVVDKQDADITQNQIIVALLHIIGDIETSIVGNPIAQQELDRFSQTPPPTNHVSNSQNTVIGNIHAGGNVIVGNNNVQQHHSGTGDNVAGNKIVRS